MECEYNRFLTTSLRSTTRRYAFTLSFCSLYGKIKGHDYSINSRRKPVTLATYQSSLISSLRMTCSCSQKSNLHNLALLLTFLKVFVLYQVLKSVLINQVFMLQKVFVEPPRSPLSPQLISSSQTNWRNIWVSNFVMAKPRRITFSWDLW